jgi:hypothetical protein
MHCAVAIPCSLQRWLDERCHANGIPGGSGFLLPLPAGHINRLSAKPLLVS